MTAAMARGASVGPNTFYVWMATACAVVAFGGFAGTYWLQLPAGTFRGPTIMHLHGVVFSLWTLLLVWQSWLGARREIAAHRAWGMFGIVLATSMVWLGLGVAIHVSATIAPQWKESSRQFLIVPVTALMMFAGYVAAGVANVRRPEWHKRLMILSTIAILDAAVARVLFLMATGGGPGARPGNGPPPPASLTGELQSDSVSLGLMVLGATYDWRTRGRPHPVWLIGIVVMLTVALLRTYALTSPQWLAVADWLIAAR